MEFLRAAKMTKLAAIAVMGLLMLQSCAGTNCGDCIRDVESSEYTYYDHGVGETRIEPVDCIDALTCIDAECSLDVAKREALKLIYDRYKCPKNASNASASGPTMTIIGACMAVLLYVWRGVC